MNMTDERRSWEEGCYCGSGQCICGTVLDPFLPVEVTDDSPECTHCGTWTCAECGWKRQQANLKYSRHTCMRCGSSQGIIEPNYHRPGTVIASTHAPGA